MRIEITKKIIEQQAGRTDASVAGAIFTVYTDKACTTPYKDANGEVVTVGPTDESGYAISGTMRTGTYYVKETTFPKGIDPDRVLPGENGPQKDMVYTFSYNNAEQGPEPIVVSKNIDNIAMVGRVQVIKLDSNNTDTETSPAEGAVLRLTLESSNGSVYYTATVGKDGSAEFVYPTLSEYYDPYTIPYGKYVLTEDQESTNGNSYHYFIQDEKINIDVKNETERRIVSDDEIDSYLRIIKVDKDTGKVVQLNGAAFKIWDVANNKWLKQVSMNGTIEEYVAQENGIMYLPEKLNAGKYILYETASPKGYYLPEKYRVPEDGIGGENKGGEPFVINKVATGIADDTQATIPELVVDVEMYDEELKGQIRIFKTGEQLTTAKTSIKVLEENEEQYKYAEPVYEEKPLKGVEYKIYANKDIVSPDGETTHYTKDSYVATIKTGEDGYAVSDKLFLGEYRVVETKNPSGYVVDATPIIVTLTNENPLQEVERKDLQQTNDRQKLKVTIDKVFEESRYSANKENKKVAIFTVSAAENIKNYEGKDVIFKDDVLYLLRCEDGKMDIEDMDLPAATYNIKEVYVTEPYSITDEVVSAHVVPNDTNDEVVVLKAGTLNNTYLKGSFFAIKLSIHELMDTPVYEGEAINEDSVNEALAAMLDELRTYTEDEINEYLQNSKYGVGDAKYGIYLDEKCTKPLYCDGEEVVMLTDEYGRIYIKDIPYGRYFIKEITAPVGYDINENVYEVSISDATDNKMIILLLSEKKTVAHGISKKDIFTSEYVPNCTFEVLNEEGEVLCYSVTDDFGYGYIPIDIFVNGETYYYHEVDAPEIYDLNPDLHPFVAEYEEVENEKGDIEIVWTGKPVEISNVRLTTKVTIIKTDAVTSELIPNCKFEIRSLENPDFVVEGITDENGICEFDLLPQGKYTYTELEAPEEYLIDTTPHEFTVGKDEVILEVTNTLKPDTGDIAVFALSAMALLSVVGIVVTLKRRALSK